MRDFTRNVFCLMTAGFFLMSGSVVTSGQITHTRGFTRILDMAQLEYLWPVEQYLHVVPSHQDGFMDYDLVLQNDLNDFEIRFRIQLPGEQGFSVPGHVEVSRLLASIATNDEVAEIRTLFCDADFAQETFHADRSMFAWFTPKASFSDKPYGVMINFSADRKGLVDIILLYRDPHYDPVSMYRNLRFRKEDF